LTRSRLELRPNHLTGWATPWSTGRQSRISRFSARRTFTRWRAGRMQERIGKPWRRPGNWRRGWHATD